MVIDAEYSRSGWSGQRAGVFYQRLRSGVDGYVLASAYREPARFALLGRSALVTDGHEHAFTSLDKDNPLIEVSQRTGRDVPP
jgi:hypothetical protein